MPLTINGKVFLNLQEAVAWLLANNALPFQCKVNYVADTEIAKSNIINPSPTEIKIGSLVLFADGKVGTVSGVSSNGFMVGAESTDLSDGVPHITDLSINASGHLIATMSEGDPIDAGLVKMVSNLTIDASQHLVVNYNDGSTQDLGAIFQGNVNIAGNLTADSIIENMSGYSFIMPSTAGYTTSLDFAGIVKNGNKLTMVIAGTLTKTDNDASPYPNLGSFVVPADIASKIFPLGNLSYVDAKVIQFFKSLGDSTGVRCYISKSGNVLIHACYTSGLTLNDTYSFRFETTFLLSENLAS